MTKTDSGRWLYCPRPNPQATLKLFCFPYAGGDALIYRSWATALPAFVELQLINLPGRGRRLGEPPLTSMPEVVRAAASAIRPHVDRPFALFGHSMGALIGFELARLLRDEYYLRPARLLVSGRTAPQLPDTDPPVHDLPEPEFIEELRRLNGTPPGVLEHPELLQLVIPMLRADFAVCETYAYEPGPPLDCPITAYGGLGDEDVSREQLEAWREQTTSSFTVRMLPGDHFFINSSRALLVESVSRELTQLAR